MKQKIIGCLSAVTLLLSSSFGVAQQISDDSKVQQERVVEPLIPEHLRHATAFVQFLQEAGVVVQEVGICHCSGMFRGDVKAAFVRTDHGIAEINVFPGARDAERITYGVSKEGRAYKYSFYGWPGPGDNLMTSAYPFYFTTYRNWFIMTRDVRLDSLLKQRARQREEEAAWLRRRA